MRRTIDQFMWAFQHTFRATMDGLAETTLRRVGAAVAPHGLLVGFAANEDARHPVCIEPEKKSFTQADLAGVEARALELHESDPERAVFNTDRGVHEQRQASLRDRARGQALCEALGASPGGAGRTFFAGVGVPVGPYIVYPVLSVLTARWSTLPALSTDMRDRMAVDRSLQHAVVRQVLGAAAQALRAQPPPLTLDEEQADIIRTSADRLVGSIVQALLRQYLGSGLKKSLDAVAAQPYEGGT